MLVGGKEASPPPNPPTHPPARLATHHPVCVVQVVCTLNRLLTILQDKPSTQYHLHPFVCSFMFLLGYAFRRQQSLSHGASCQS